MTVPTDNNISSPHQNLRQAAHTALSSDQLDINSGWTLTPETLSLLYRLASEPENAADALKLLHELQTHQVELELQYRQLLDNEQFIRQQLSKFKALLDASAIGFIMADAEGKIMEINQAAIALLDINDQTVIGTPISQFFQAHAQTRLQHLFKQLSEHVQAEDVVCIVPPRSHDVSDIHLKVTANISIAGNAVLMTIMEYSPSQLP